MLCKTKTLGDNGWWKIEEHMKKVFQKQNYIWGIKAKVAVQVSETRKGKLGGLCPAGAISVVGR